MKFIILCLAASSMLVISSAAWYDWLHGGPQIPLLSQTQPSEHSHRIPDHIPDEHVKSQQEFSLRHIFHHRTDKPPYTHLRFDMQPKTPEWVLKHGADERVGADILRVRSKSVSIERLSNHSPAQARSMYHTARLTGAAATLSESAWSIDTIPGPDTRDKETVTNLARMTWNAYTKEPGTGEWQDETGHFNHSQSFGWEGDSLRGHVFANKDNSTIIIALKGTSPAVFDGAETTTNDKVNDNLFFGCCCGQGGHYLWHQVCDCMTSAYTCNSTCLVKAIREENRYYAASIELYGNVTHLYPNSSIWLTGHSLGGSTSSLLGLTFGLPVTTFEAPGDALAAARLGLPSPPSAHSSAPQTRRNTGAVHFGHTADPIFMGTCNAATSGCTLGGYSMQTECHTGVVCRYDTVEDKGWRVGIGYHRIRAVIQDVLEAYDDIPPCVADDECIDCFNWKYYQSNGSDTTSTTTSTSSVASPTRTATCETPGWWGCLDESTTTSRPSTSTSTSDLPSTSCVKYGWFGGCVETTTFQSTTTLSATPTSCSKHGWLGGCVSPADPFPTSKGAKATPGPTRPVITNSMALTSSQRTV